MVWVFLLQQLNINWNSDIDQDAIFGPLYFELEKKLTHYVHSPLKVLLET